MDINNAALVLVGSASFLVASNVVISSWNLSFLSEKVGLVSNPHKSSSPNSFPNPDANFLPSILILISSFWWTFANASNERLRKPFFLHLPCILWRLLAGQGQTEQQNWCHTTQGRCSCFWILTYYIPYTPVRIWCLYLWTLFYSRPKCHRLWAVSHTSNTWFWQKCGHVSNKMKCDIATQSPRSEEVYKAPEITLSLNFFHLWDC